MKHGIFSDFRGRITGWTAALSLVGVAACDNDDGQNPPPDTATGIAIAGTWTSEFGDEIITDTTWTNYLAQIVISYDNANRKAILRNPPDAEWGPNDFSRVVWIGPEGDVLHYCVEIYGQPTQADAETATAEGIDAADLTGTGCAGFPWSRMTRKP